MCIGQKPPAGNPNIRLFNRFDLPAQRAHHLFGDAGQHQRRATAVSIQCHPAIHIPLERFPKPRDDINVFANLIRRKPTARIGSKVLDLLLNAAEMLNKNAGHSKGDDACRLYVCCDVGAKKIAVFRRP